MAASLKIDVRYNGGATYRRAEVPLSSDRTLQTIHIAPVKTPGQLDWRDESNLVFCSVWLSVPVAVRPSLSSAATRGFRVRMRTAETAGASHRYPGFPAVGSGDDAAHARFLTERRTWFCLVQRDRKSGYAPVAMKISERDAYAKPLCNYL